MYTNLQLQTFEINHLKIALYVPDKDSIRQQYLQQKKDKPDTPFPYWARVWPSALALATFIQSYPDYIRGKKVLEIAGGLGLPSLIAAPYALHVCCTDYLPEAVAAIEQSARYHKVSNLQCRLLNWNAIPPDLDTDVLLLSDINYEPTAFEQLYQVLDRFIKEGTMIILSTPQRLMAKTFIERLLPWVQQQVEIKVLQEEQQHTITLLVMQLPDNNHNRSL